MQGRQADRRSLAAPGGDVQINDVNQQVEAAKGQRKKGSSRGSKNYFISR